MLGALSLLVLTSGAVQNADEGPVPPEAPGASVEVEAAAPSAEAEAEAEVEAEAEAEAEVEVEGPDTAPPKADPTPLHAEDPPAKAEDASPTTEDTLPRLLVLPLASESVKSEPLRVLDGKVASALSGDQRLDVITHEDLERIMELEAEKASLGCDTEACLTEVAGALGADLVIYGRVARVEEIIVLQLSLFEASRARVVARRDVEAPSITTLKDRIDIIVRSLVGELHGESIPVEFDDSEPEPGVATGDILLYGGAGVGALGAAGFLFGVALLGVGITGFNVHTLDPSLRGLAQIFAWVGLISTGVSVLILGGGAVAGVAGLVVE